MCRYPNTYTSGRQGQNSQMSQHFQHDVLVIGSGAAGLSLALTLPDHLRIAVLSKGDLANGSTFWAQGGVAAVL
ncbi:L-aspartate oxidase, partial [Pseudomonas syringae pv. papulans]